MFTVHSSDEERDCRAKDGAMTVAEALEGTSIHIRPQQTVQETCVAHVSLQEHAST